MSAIAEAGRVSQSSLFRAEVNPKWLYLRTSRASIILMFDILRSAIVRSPVGSFDHPAKRH